MKKNSVLANLGWPFSLIEKPGRLQWSETGDEWTISASVRADDEKIVAFCSSYCESAMEKAELAMEWTLRDGKAQEVSAQRNGEPADFGKALESFQEMISKCGAPSFAPAAGHDVQAPGKRGI